MQCENCKTKINKKRRSKVCEECEEKQLWKKYCAMQKKLTKKKCLKKKIDSKGLILHLKESIKELKVKEKSLVCIFHLYFLLLYFSMLQGICVVRLFCL